MTSNSRFRIMRAYSKFELTRSDEASKNYWFELESAVNKNREFPSIVWYCSHFLTICLKDLKL